FCFHNLELLLSLYYSPFVHRDRGCFVAVHPFHCPVGTRLGINDRILFLEHLENCWYRPMSACRYIYNFSHPSQYPWCNQRVVANRKSSRTGRCHFAKKVFG